MPTSLIVLLLWVLLYSFASLVLMGWDKRQAMNQGPRIPEWVLHAFELLGGWPGSLLASYGFKHKSVKLSYRIVRWLCIGLNVAAITGILWLLFRGQ